MPDLRESKGLFGLRDTNCDFTKASDWGKNKFPSAFPAALACYMGYMKFDPVYLCLDDNKNVVKNSISVADLLGIRLTNTTMSYDFQTTPDLHFHFEGSYTSYNPLVIGTLPRIDLVTQSTTGRQVTDLRGLEVKLTAVPDNTTSTMHEDQYGAEIVVRRDTIVYLASSIALIVSLWEG